MSCFEMRKPTVFRRCLAGLCIGLVALQAGCYAYTPVQSDLPPASTRISLTINDQGRALLVDRVGALTDRIEGNLVHADSLQLLVGVTRVVNLRGDGSNWTGEQISIPRSAILGYQGRPFSKQRTVVLVAALVGALTLIALSISLKVAAGPGTSDEPPTGGVLSLKGR